MKRQLLLDALDTSIDFEGTPLVVGQFAGDVLDVSDYPALRVAFRPTTGHGILTLRWQADPAAVRVFGQLGALPLLDVEHTYEVGDDGMLHLVTPVRAPWLDVSAEVLGAVEFNGRCDCRIWGLDTPVDRVRSITGGVLTRRSQNLASGGSMTSDLAPYVGPAQFHTRLWDAAPAAGQHIVAAVQVEDPLGSGTWLELVRHDSFDGQIDHDTVELPARRLRVQATNFTAATHSVAWSLVAPHG